jgi:hypothetical protein
MQFALHSSAGHSQVRPRKGAPRLAVYKESILGSIAILSQTLAGTCDGAASTKRTGQDREAVESVSNVEPDQNADRPRCW